MKSKIALAEIIFQAKMEKPLFNIYYREYIEPIERDLEILEILKKHLKLTSRIGMGAEKYKDIDFTLISYEDDDQEIIMEWLKNDNQN